MSAMPPSPLSRPTPSRGPRRQWVRRAAALLDIVPLLPEVTLRPVPLSQPWLEAFSAAMARAGHGALVSRMAFDRIYARERLVRALACDDPALRDMAAELRGALKR
ncbi:hypothetical protein [Aquabacterium sp. J223]|uniref:hypothetical protein n=1 Tax=Aquabacterium sp. J223 TaxID=2898431 RepID=UPI0021AD6175|nr:hypothetical protein [Aquabacterium sp. J223]UUX96197.1 hypothetical protein LRS07_02360 [Aquabacterium sp. J223]